MVFRLLQFLTTLVVAVLIGMLLTWAVGVLISLDLGHQWRRLPALTTDAGAIVDIWEGTVYVRGSDGQLYAIEPKRDIRWADVHTIRSTDDSYYSRREFFGACDRTDARFRWTAAPPSDVIECIEARTFMSVSTFSLAIIRDAHNQLWFFQTELGSDFAVPGLIVGLLCFLLTTCIAFFLLRAIIPFTRNNQR
jgi:hypothetical protein